MTTIYLPDSEPRPHTAALAASPASLRGLRIAVLDNGKPNAVTVMARAAETLAARTGATVSLVVKKGPGGRSANAAIPCADDIFEQVVREADLVITGAADCGSCTAYSVYDAISFEKVGLPAVVVTTTKFEPIAATMASDFGMPDARTLVLPHPFGGTDRETLWSWADDATARLEALFLGGPTVAPPPVRADLAQTVDAAMASVQAIVEADGSRFEILDVDADGVVALRLVIEDTSCADCVMPRDLLEPMVLKTLRAAVPSVVSVVITDPRQS